MEKFIRQLEGRVEEGEASAVLGVEKYDSLIRNCAELQPKKHHKKLLEEMCLGGLKLRLKIEKT